MGFLRKINMRRKLKAAWQKFVVWRLKQRYVKVTQLKVKNAKHIWQEMDTGSFFAGPASEYLSDFALRTYEPEIIIGVAHNHCGILFVGFKPYRHHHLIWVMGRLGIRRSDIRCQGFFTSHGRYVNRREAMKIARANNQLISEPHNTRQLFSEEVWEIPEALNVYKPKT